MGAPEIALFLSEMRRLLFIGLGAAFFFSSTFVLNRAMSLSGGSWIWSASLRYGYMIIFLAAWIALRNGAAMLGKVFQEFRAHLPFWILTGTIGVGIFYGSVCFASAHAPAWIIATTWQFTIVAGVLIFPLFGKSIPTRALMTSILIFGGLFLVDLSARRDGGVELWTVLPMLFAAFAYPIGNQIVGEAKNFGSGPKWIPRAWIPPVANPVMDLAPARVLLMSLGSVPFWLISVGFVRPPLPSSGQLMEAAAVALLSGVIGTSLFLHARHAARNSVEIAAVDATQALEIIFALGLEMIFLGGKPPGANGLTGLVLVLAGLLTYSRVEREPATRVGRKRLTFSRRPRRQNRSPALAVKSRVE